LPKAYGNWEELISDPGIDAVAIAVPPLVQKDIALAALANGKHVFCEKPIAANLAGATELFMAARDSGKAHIVDFEFPEIGVWRHAKALLSSGAIGSVSHVTVSWHVETYANRMGIRSWKTDSGMGGGTLNSFVSHCFNYLEWLIGPIGEIGARLFLPTGRPDAAGDTMAVLWLEHRNGVPSSLCVCGGSFLATGHRVTIYGQQGSLVLDNPSRDYVSGFTLWHGTRETDKLECVGREPVDTPETDGRIAPVGRLAKRFVMWAREGAAGAPDIGDGLRVQQLLDAARRSNATGRRIAP